MNYNNTLYYGVSKTQIGTYSQIQSVSSIANNALNIANNANANANTKVQMQIVSYVGTGVSGKNNPCSISFSFPPDVVIYIGNRSVNGGSFEFFQSIDNPYVLCSLLDASFSTPEYLAFGCYAKISSDRKTISWYHYYSNNDNENQLNSANTNYYFMALKSKV